MSAGALAYQPWLEALEADTRTIYSRYFQYGIIPFLLAYCVWVMVVPATQETDMFGDILYVSPEGVRMHLTKPLEKWRLFSHSLAGVIMIVATLFQKHSAARMAQNMKDIAFPPPPASAKADDDDNNTKPKPATVSLFRRLHAGVVGPCTLGCMTMMAVAGFAMRSFSMLQNFSSVMWLFVAPWPILGGIIYFSAKIASRKGAWAGAAAKTHVIFGNALVYACIAVVYARLMGAVLQRTTVQLWDAICVLGNDREGIQEWAAWVVCQIMPECIMELGDSRGYYTGIALSTILFSVVILVESIIFLKACRYIHERDAKGWASLKESSKDK